MMLLRPARFQAANGQTSYREANLAERLTESEKPDSRAQDHCGSFFFGVFPPVPA